MASGSGSYNPKSAEEILEIDSSYRHQNRQESGSSQPCHHYFSTALVKITLLFVTVALACLVLSRSAYPTEFIQKSYSFLGPKDGSAPGNLSSPPTDKYNTMQENGSSLSNNTKENNENDLESTLRKASMEDHKTVIITTLNAAWTEPDTLFDLFLESFRIGNQTEHLLNHLVVAAFDEKAYSRCLEVHKHCYRLITLGVDFSSEAHFMSEDYLKMMWRRIEFLRTVLELGYNFVFTDADVMWLRDPFQRFFPDGDFQIACDHYWFNSTDSNNSPNGGFNYVKANNRTVAFYNFWHGGRAYFPGKHDQDVLNMIKFNPFIQEIGLEMRYFDTAYFGGFCEPSKDLDLVITMHANCCIGMENKIHDIKMVIDDWKKYVALPSGERNLSSRSWTVPRICG